MSQAKTGVIAVQCAKCRMYMLVEESERGKIVPCLVCKNPIRVGTLAKESKPKG
jgi:hypothetical protein